MIERCPVCHARLNNASICLRCHADLSDVIANIQQAEFWMVQAQQFWMLREIPMAIAALKKSLRCKETPTTKAFLNFICQKHYPRVLSLLAQNQLIEAEQLLEQLDTPHSEQPMLKQLKAFCHYLHSQEHE